MLGLLEQRMRQGLLVSNLNVTIAKYQAKEDRCQVPFCCCCCYLLRGLRKHFVVSLILKMTLNRGYRSCFIYEDNRCPVSSHDLLEPES